MELVIIIVICVVIYNLFLKKDNSGSSHTQVRSYKRRDGTNVRSHPRRKRKK